MLSHFHQRLCDDGWQPSTERFWETAPCFYDLGLVKTVILFRVGNAISDHCGVFYWKLGGHDLPAYLAKAEAEIRRYKLHYSMNALLWHAHGDRPLWPR